MKLIQHSSSQHGSNSKGFSLVELLMTISILGILLAILIVNLAVMGDSANETRHQRNAQEIAAICSAAEAAGLDFVAGNDLEKTIKNIIAGGTPTEGAFRGKNFSVKHLAAADIEGVKHFLSLDGGLLRYSRARLK
jgi:prepilin-type N-terminal cleavage/methylation domain-containing protein